jgi:nucleotide-binding universal stress UspA family protein
MSENLIPAKAPTQIIWAVNPSVGESELLRAGAAAVRSLGGEPRVQPIYAISKEDFESSAFRWQASSQVEEAAAREGVKTQPLDFVVLESHGLANRVAGVVQRFRNLHADLVVVATRSQTGPKRWIAGSFAEEAVLQSGIPFLVVNPHWERRATFQKVFFPTDFSASSEKALEDVISLARELHAELTLYHQFRYYPPATLEYSMQSTEAYRLAYDEELAQIQRKMSTWCTRVSRHGLRAGP